MKNLKVISLLVLTTLFLNACGDDSSGSSLKYSGSKADINAAKKLVHEYSDKDDTVVYERGYIDYNQVRNNLYQAVQLSSQANDYQKAPNSFYAMRYVGCLASDGSRLPVGNQVHTQMDLVVGESSTRAVYVQQNKLDKCYLGSISINGSYGLNGNILGSINKSKGIIALPKNACQNLSIQQALVRIKRSKFVNNYKEDKRNSRKYRDQDYYYWNTRHRWIPEEDSYYNINGNYYNIFDNRSWANYSNKDSFGKITSKEAVFVTEAFNRRGQTQPGCVKNVYWGFRINEDNPPPIQILSK